MTTVGVWKWVLCQPNGTTPAEVVKAWGMGGRVLDLPSYYQNRALELIDKLPELPAALALAQARINGGDHER